MPLGVRAQTSALPSPSRSGNWIVPHSVASPLNPAASLNRVSHGVGMPKPEVPSEIPHATPLTPRPQTSALPSPLTSGNRIVAQYDWLVFQPPASVKVDQRVAGPKPFVPFEIAQVIPAAA